MKRFAFVLILLIAIVGFLGWAIAQDPGYVLISK